MKNQYILILLFFGSFVTLLAQNPSHDNTPAQKIKNALEDYFLLDRENIHVHFDKTVFLSNEEIWFKGYVFNRKSFSPSNATTNIYGVLLDQNGQKLSEKLFFATNGSFSGSFQLDKSYPSGFYYVQFFTNWMNNFDEDESSVSKLEIINPESLQRVAKAANPTVTIELHPEGGNFVSGIKNIVSVKISDCYGDPIPLETVKIVDDQNRVITTVSVNKFGYGKFELTPTQKQYTAIVNTNDREIRQNLPVAATKGFAMHVNNFSIDPKTILKISTTADYAREIKNSKFIIAINRDEKTSVIELDFADGNPDQIVSFSKDFLFDGVNTIRILDQNLNELCQRMLFKFPEKNQNLNIAATKTSKDISLTGVTPFLNANMSATVVQENTETLEFQEDIYASLLINPYVAQKIEQASYYFSENTKAKSFELDLIMLHQKGPKYDWIRMLQGAPVKKYEFDAGLTLKGKLLTPLKDPSKYVVKLFSILASLDEGAKVEPNNEFYFHNLALADSTSVNLSLFSTADLRTSLPAKMQVVTLNGKRTFGKPFKPDYPNCATELVKVDLPINAIQNSIALDTVTINKSKVSSGLLHERKSGNWMFRGYKVDQKIQNMLLRDFIRLNGFDVSYDRTGQMVITGRRSNSMNADSKTQPLIYIDDIQQFSLMQLENLRMDQLEEIYINTNYVMPGLNRNVGIIKFYMKKSSPWKASDYKGNATVYTVLDGFEKNRTVQLLNSQNNTAFGILKWLPNITADENGKFEMTIPLQTPDKIKLLIEGTNPEGKLISEIIPIDLNTSN